MSCIALMAGCRCLGNLLIYLLPAHMSDTVLSSVDSSIATLDVDQICLRSAHFVFDCDLDCLT